MAIKTPDNRAEAKKALNCEKVKNKLVFIQEA
jgi:hypothetical protein